MVVEKILLICQFQAKTAYGGYISCTIGMKYGNCVQNLPYGNNSLCLLVLVEQINKIAANQKQ